MEKGRFSRVPARLLVLITLACVLLFVAPADRVATVPVPAASPTVSPTPVPTPKDDEERPNAVRRFFSWVKDGVTRPWRKRRPEINDHYIVVSLSSSKSVITFCPRRSLVIDCQSSQEVKLTAAASAPEQKELLFTWMVTSGRLRGDGREVIWDLSGVPEGTYTATVEVNDGYQRTAAGTTKVTVSLCDGCERPPPLCPSITVSCPSGVEREITFVANVSGGEPDLKPTYTWSLTAGKIVSGQGTSKITIDASDVPRSQSLTATVSLGGFHPACTGGTASCTITHWD